MEWVWGGGIAGHNSPSGPVISAVCILCPVEWPTGQWDPSVHSCTAGGSGKGQSFAIPFGNVALSTPHTRWEPQNKNKARKAVKENSSGAAEQP